MGAVLATPEAAHARLPEETARPVGRWWRFRKPERIGTSDDVYDTACVAVEAGTSIGALSSARSTGCSI